MVISRALPAAIALSVTQVIGWATAFNALALLAQPIAVELAMPMPVVLGGSSVFLVAMALVSRLLVPVYARVGAGPVLVAGSVAASMGFAALALSAGWLGYGLGWVMLGAAAAAMLTAPAHAVMVQLLGRDAKRWIAGVMLVTGLAGSFGLPATALLLEWTDWRGVFWVFAAAHLAVCAPLHLWVSRLAGPPVASPASPDTQISSDDGRLFHRLVTAVSLIGFVTWGFAIVIIELLQQTGLSRTEATAAAALIGVATVAARAAEFLFARSLAASQSAIWATAGLCLALILLGSGAPWAFVALFGAASGIMSVARATLPLELFAPGDYAAMAGRLALPMTLTFAAAPLVFGVLLHQAGAQAALALALLAGVAALLALISLRRMAQEKGRA